MTRSFVFEDERYDKSIEDLKKVSDEKLHKLNTELHIAENVYMTIYGKTPQKISLLSFRVSNEDWQRHYGDYRHPVNGKEHTCYHREAYYATALGEDKDL